MKLTTKAMKEAERKKKHGWARRVRKALQGLRRDRDLKIDAIAARCGLSDDVIRRYIRLERVPKYATIRHMEREFGITILPTNAAAR